MKKEIEDFMKGSILTLEKINSTNGYQPYVVVGHKVSGKGLILDWDEDFSVQVSGTSTSLVKKIIYKSDNKLIFETLNSVYDLIKVD